MPPCQRLMPTCSSCQTSTFQLTSTCLWKTSCNQLTLLTARTCSTLIKQLKEAWQNAQTIGTQLPVQTGGNNTEFHPQFQQSQQQVQELWTATVWMKECSPIASWLKLGPWSKQPAMRRLNKQWLQLPKLLHLFFTCSSCCLSQRETH